MVVVGERYGAWEVIGDVEREIINTPNLVKKTQHRVSVLCLCTKCNITKKNVDYYKLVRNESKGCKQCNSGRPPHYLKEYKGIKEVIFQRMKSVAKTRKIPFSLTMEHLGDLFEKQKGICALSGLPLSLKVDAYDSAGTASVDRIDSAKGYMPKNIQWVHKIINMMKGQLPESEFIKFCKTVANHKTIK